MKKKIFIILCSVFMITGCGNPTGEISNIDIEKSMTSIKNKITTLDSAIESELMDVYGVDTSLMEKYDIQISNTQSLDIVAIIQVSEKNKVEVKKQMTAYFNTLASQSEMYSPESVKKIKNHLETEVGDYLIYIVSDDNPSIYNLIKENIQ